VTEAVVALSQRRSFKQVECQRPTMRLSVRCAVGRCERYRGGYMHVICGGGYMHVI